MPKLVKLKLAKPLIFVRIHLVCSMAGPLS